MEIIAVLIGERIEGDLNRFRLTERFELGMYVTRFPVDIYPHLLIQTRIRLAPEEFQSSFPLHLRISLSGKPFAFTRVQVVSDFARDPLFPDRHLPHNVNISLTGLTFPVQGLYRFSVQIDEGAESWLDFAVALEPPEYRESSDANL